MGIDISNLGGITINWNEDELSGGDVNSDSSEPSISPPTPVIDEFGNFNDASAQANFPEIAEGVEEASENVEDIFYNFITSDDIVFNKDISDFKSIIQINNLDIVTSERPPGRSRKLVNFQNSYSSNQDIKDKLRYFGGFYWIVNGYRTQTPILFDKDFSQIDIPFKISIESEGPSLTSGLNIDITRIKLVPEAKEFSDDEGFLIPNQWRSFLFGTSFDGFTHEGAFEVDTLYEDFSFDVGSLVDLSAVEEDNFANINTANLSANYTYLNEDLERFVEDTEENLIIDVDSTAYKDLYETNNSIIDKHVTLYNNITNYDGLDGDHIDDWVYSNSLLEEGQRRQLEDNYKYKLVKNLTDEYRSEVRSEILFYPYYIQCEFDMYGLGPIGNMLKDIDMFNVYFQDGVAKTYAVTEFNNNISYMPIYRTDKNYEGNQFGFNTTQSEIKQWSVAGSFEDILSTEISQDREVIGVDIDNEESNVSDFNSDFLPDIEEEEEESGFMGEISDLGGSDEDEGGFFNSLGFDQETIDRIRETVDGILDTEALLDEIFKGSTVIFEDFSEDNISGLFGGSSTLDDIEQYIRDNYRSYSDILKGESAPAEVLGFKISKYDFELDNGRIEDLQDPVQEVLVPNMSSAFEHIDSQVKYGKNYDYEISAFVLVIGNKYQYKTDGEFESDFGLKMRVLNSPSVKLFEVPLVDLGNISILDKPPVIPDVDIKAYKGIKDKLLLNLSKGIGKFFEKPIDFFTGEGVEEIEFNSDGPVSSFEIFRLTEAPSSYRDFGGRKIAEVGTSLVNSGNGYVDQVSYKSDIQPDTDYYYTFRSRDFHGNVSNPTEIFKVRMHTNNSANSLDIDLFEFKERGSDSIEFARFLNIEPTLDQKEISLNAANREDIGDQEFTDSLVSVGPEQNPVWDEEFKFRITSKATNKKVDINCKFKKTNRGFRFSFGDTQKIVVADTFTEALQYLLIEQELELI